MPIDLFNQLTAEDQQHPIFQMMLREPYGPEREVLNQWAEGFEDRDGKFVKEFQKTFESSFWELYLHAALKAWGLSIDLRHHAPDFLVGGPIPFCLERQSRIRLLVDNLHMGSHTSNRLLTSRCLISSPRCASAIASTRK
ncbi:hypothetical protein [Pseudomonas sp. SHC52]|uniref:hypothetical protein n=1 Tax=Pseudomonas sp. SHC52 TaxID=984195 RepID=UPI00210E89EF|nr:hypothetical protein [Pseudomonas sp. SHC52]